MRLKSSSAPRNRRLPSSQWSYPRRFSKQITACLLSLILACNVIRTATSTPIHPNPGSHNVLQQAALRANEAEGTTGNANLDNNVANNRRRSRNHAQGPGGRDGVAGYGKAETGHHFQGDGGGAFPQAVEVSGADLATRGAVQLDGVYMREWDVNGAPHFKRRSKVCLRVDGWILQKW